MGCLASKEEVNTGKYAVGARGGSSLSREAADAVALVTGSNVYSSWVEIQASCKNLRTADTFSKSDPMIILLQQQMSGWKEVGRTEVISNNESPVFVKVSQYSTMQNRKQRLPAMDVRQTRGGRHACCMLIGTGNLGTWLLNHTLNFTLHE